jgi:hypothetical protein
MTPAVRQDRDVIWDATLAQHTRAVEEYAAAARRVAAVPGLWLAGPADGRWSPAQITQHLVMAFEAVSRELAGEPGMALRTTAWQRLLLRFTIQRRLLRGGAFPQGARSPREARPPATAEDAATLVPRFEVLAAALESRLAERRDADPRAQLTHPYFGRLSLRDTVYISARHIDHHRAQLPA